MKKDVDYYLNLNWTLIEGEDLDFEGNPYHYIEIKEIPSFAFCAKTIEKARENYKKQLKLQLMIMLEDGEDIVEPGQNNEDDEDFENLCPGG
jgi:predicted RNase H-like HicB family nuclease